MIAKPRLVSLHFSEALQPVEIFSGRSFLHIQPHIPEERKGCDKQKGKESKKEKERTKLI